MIHEVYMNRCFQLASQGSGNVAPNPLVGAVVVHNALVIAEGFHNEFGGPHAEVMALNQLTNTSVLENSTLYVNLEPCSHTGKTPPCSNLIIEKGIKQVVIANQDPFPKVNGSGIQQLLKAGVNVTKGILEAEGRALNRRFFTYHLNKRPYVILKWAQTKNGFIAPAAVSDKKQGITWISNEASRLLVHSWRSEEQAILVGSGTVQADNPRLNVRGVSGSNPVRVIIDPGLSLSMDYHVFDKSVKTFIFNFRTQNTDGNNCFTKIKNNPEFIRSVLKVLYNENLQSVLIEGGAYTINQFIKSGFWDEARIFTGQHCFDQGIPAPIFNGIPSEQHDVAGDVLRIYYNQSAS